MYALEAEIRALAERFISDLVTLIQHQPFAESADALAEATTPMSSPASTRRVKAASLAKREAAPRSRRSTEEVLELRDRIIALVKEAPEGLAVREMAARLGVSAKEITRPLALATQSGALVRQGEKRLARYFAAQKAA